MLKLVKRLLETIVHALRPLESIIHAFELIFHEVDALYMLLIKLCKSLFKVKELLLDIYIHIRLQPKLLHCVCKPLVSSFKEMEHENSHACCRR